MNKKIIIFLLFIIGLASSYRLFRPGYFSMQDDMHIFRLQQLDECLSDGQIPCRYIPDGGFGYGYPLYNFYSPLPYYLSLSVHYLGFSYIDSIKAIFILTSFLRPLGIFLFVSALFGIPAGVGSAAIFALAPYQALNSFVRGAFAENLAISLIPFIFWSLYSKKYYLFTFFVFLLALSHNLTLLYTIPLLFLFILIFTKKQLFLGLKFFVLGILMASFFLLPAFFEKNLTTVSTMTEGYFSFVNHFATLKQLFLDFSWNYGASLWGPIDDMSFQIGYLQWLLPLISLYFIRSKHVFFWTSIGYFFLFLTHNKSGFLWANISILPFYQFPWRFLGPAIFSFSLASAPLFVKFKKLIIPTLLITLILSFRYFKEDIWYSSLTDSDRFTKSEIIRQSGAGLKDYWPKYSTTFPTEFASEPAFLSGLGTIDSFSKTSNQAVGTIVVDSDSAIVSLPVVYFPKFSLTINDLSQNYLIDKNTGLITLLLPQGENKFVLRFVDTPLRFISNIISLTTFSIFILLIIFRAKKK